MDRLILGGGGSNIAKTVTVEISSSRILEEPRSHPRAGRKCEAAIAAAAPELEDSRRVGHGQIEAVVAVDIYDRERRLPLEWQRVIHGGCEGQEVRHRSRTVPGLA